MTALLLESSETHISSGIKLHDCILLQHGLAPHARYPVLMACEVKLADTAFEKGKMKRATIVSMFAIRSVPVSLVT